MTDTQKRGALLKNRLDILNDYLVTENGTGKTFEQFLREKKVKKETFVAGLPSGLKNPPAIDYQDVFDYATKMNDLYFGQYMAHMKERELAAADGDSGVVDGDYTTAMVRGDVDPEVLEEYAADGCGLPPIKPVRSRRRAPERWAEYDRKKAAYDKCRAEKKEHKQEKKDAKKGGERKGLHNLNKANPAFVVARSAFLSVLFLNIFKMAYNLDKMRSKSPKLWKKMKAKWYNIGGDVDKLEKNIDKGKNKKGIFGKKMAATGEFVYDGTYSIAGGDDVAIGTYLANAAAVIAFIKPLLKAFKKEQGEPTDTPDIEALPEDPGGPVSDAMRIETPEEDIAPDGGSKDEESFWDKNKVAIMIGGAVVLVGAVIGIAMALRKK